MGKDSEMASPIGWCDCTINPVIGCTHYSPGCEHCYAERFADRLSQNPATAEKYAGITEKGKWTGRVKTFFKDKDMPHLVPGTGKRVFIGSMTDIFQENVTDDDRDAIFASILADYVLANGHKHIFFTLTKRAEKMSDYFSEPVDILLRRWVRAGDKFITAGKGKYGFAEYCHFLMQYPVLDVEMNEHELGNFPWPLPNLALGATVCNQDEADKKIYHLLDSPASQHFLSVEPMLGPITLPKVLGVCAKCGSWSGLKYAWDDPPYCEECGADPAETRIGLDWIACGGENGPDARPMRPEWVRDLQKQCADLDIEFRFKGWGNEKRQPPIPVPA